MTENIIILLLFTLVVIALFILSVCQLLLFLRIKNGIDDAALRAAGLPAAFSARPSQ